MIAEPCGVCVAEKLRRVVILGGGFGGLSAAQALKRAAVVTLIDHRNSIYSNRCSIR
jgi:NADH dehydrogenase FAD-containing subunit